MKMFSYVSKDSNGKKVKGMLNAADRQTAIDALRERSLFVTEIKELDNNKKNVLGFISSKPSSSDLMIFTTQLAIALEAGLHLTKSLAMISRDLPNGRIKHAVHRIAEEIEQGSNISKALDKHPDVFPRYYRNLIKAGEYSGELETVLNNLVDYLEREEKTRNQVMKALYYPGAIIIFSFVIVYGIISFVVPKFREFYDTFGGELPAPTRMFLNVSDFLSANALLILTSLVLGTMFLVKLIKSKEGNEFLDKYKLKIAVLNELFLKSAISRFAGSLSIMYKAGVPIVEAIEISAETTGNIVIEELIKNVAKRVKDGDRLTIPLRQSGLFTNIAIGMLDMGEETGKLQFMLEKLGILYEREVENKIKTITSLIEPALMIFMGIIIGFTLVIMALPIVNLPNVILK